MKYEDTIRFSFTDEAMDRIKEHLDDLRGYGDQELILMGMSVLLDRVGKDTKYLDPHEEAIRLTINRRLNSARD